MMRKQKKVATNKSEVVRDVPLACADEDAAVEFLERLRWGDEPACPRCGGLDVYQMKDRKTGGRNGRYLWRCRDCNRQYTVRIGTVFEDSRIPLKHWCYGFWAACASKKGVSAKQIERMTGLSYPSALFMMHRIRWAMADNSSNPPKLMGEVEADETYVGGKPRYKGTGYATRSERKTPVMVLVERNGRARARAMQKVTEANVSAMLGDNIDLSARLLTDENPSYKRHGKPFRQHDVVRHSRGEYVRGDVHNNTAESFFSLLKRGLYGTFHSVSKQHLHRYVSEFEFRWNTRKLDDGERVARAIRKAEGKRLRYAEPGGGS